MEFLEGIRTGVDAVTASAAFSWSFLGSLVDTALDVLSGRQLPEPDLKSIAEAPEPGAVCRAKPPKAIPRTSRAAVRDKVA